jgi:hypothetical protein
LYASKAKFDAVCAEARLPRETMEQHLYTFLNQRYGLKSLIVDHATSVLKSIARHAPHDSETSIFGRILRNEVDEEFRHVTAQVRTTARDLLKLGLKRRYPQKTDPFLLDLLATMTGEKEDSAGTLVLEDWRDIVEYMYSEQDALLLTQQLQEVVVREAAQELKLSIPRAEVETIGILSAASAAATVSSHLSKSLKGRERRERRARAHAHETATSLERLQREGRLTWHAFLETLLLF